MKQLPDFDLSIVIPFDKCFDEFKCSISSKAKYYERNGIEVIVVVGGELSEQEDLLDYIRTYPFINWKIVLNTQKHSWPNFAKAFNVGIRHATKLYVLVMDPDLEFYTDAIYELREKLDSYPEYYAVGQVMLKNKLIPYKSILAKKEYFERVGGYDEYYTEWERANENLCRRLELAGIYRLFFPEAILVGKEDFSQRLVSRNEQLIQVSCERLSEVLLPVEIKVNKPNLEIVYDTVIYDWKEHPYAKEQCQEYLSTLKEFDIRSNDIFEKKYPLIALIPTYNESERIADCMHSVEKYCDGIILLDDDSTDDTYQISQSDKLLIKAKKIRTEFNDKQNRNILLDIASFFKAAWFIFIDADERFDDRFVDLREVMKNPDVDTVGVWIANLWDSMETYRTDMEDTNPNSKNGLWFRWRMFRNKGRMQIQANRTLHFSAVPYGKVGKNWISKSLLIHLGYMDDNTRLNKYRFYQIEDYNKILSYDVILSEWCQLSNVQDITLAIFEV